eukprot:TRINITY_DN4088_c1_g1_i2.p1 TRINITY_DN4088_c1_g1~~TRINITY_DN4088_c1_g1_i2.p1  ORF type:complete len:405 (-),score=66.56 TRINITY_DN4088_c1_g1_i2:142-1266(-)
MPDAVLALVFGYLGTNPRANAVVQLVCRRWCEVARSPEAWEHLGFCFDSAEQVRAAALVAHVRQNLRWVFCYASVKDPFTLLAAGNFCGVRRILTAEKTLDQHQSTMLALACPNLEFLSVAAHKVTKLPGTLTSLMLDATRSPGFAATLKGCALLTTLDLGLVHFQDAVRLEDISAACPALTRLLLGDAIKAGRNWQPGDFKLRELWVRDRNWMSLRENLPTWCSELRKVTLGNPEPADNLVFVLEFPETLHVLKLNARKVHNSEPLCHLLKLCKHVTCLTLEELAVPLDAEIAATLLSHKHLQQLALSFQHDSYHCKCTLRALFGAAAATQRRGHWLDLAVHDLPEDQLATFTASARDCGIQLTRPPWPLPFC